MNADQHHQHQQHRQHRQHGDHHQSHGHGHEHGHGHGHGPAEESALAEMLDLDAEVLHDYLTGATALIHGLTAGDPPVRRILDVGSGTGTGTFALLRRFEAAEATTLDISAAMLEHLGKKARALGLADRVHPVRADLDAAWPAVGPADLVWASTSLHHMADPGRALAEIHAALRPGGLLAVAEFDTFPRFLPEDLGTGRPGLEERAHALLDAAKAEDMPHLGSDWGALLTGAGFAVEAERLFTVELTDPLPAAAGRYARSTLSRVRDHLADRLDAEDLATFGTLLDGEGPDALPHRTDLRVSAQRTVWVARRP
ncbi:class I SAM-dependent methyltransferase [Streptomyces sp. NPDC059443]|uniref:class I SAM-dependent methyltransferase n=1 Tax=unclassified Streptomyces TaxID=2593676 RepID=UPI0036A4C7C7